MKKTFIILSIVGIMLGGCAALDETNKAAEKVSNVTQTAQTILNINSITGKEFTLENSDITITFDNNKVYGFSGVNRYFGTVKVEKNKITIENIASTMMAGLPSKMEEETNYLKTLAEITTLTLKENTLVLTGNGKTLNFLGK